MSRPIISFVIPTYNKLEYTKPFLQSLLAAVPLGSEIILVDNGSTDGTADFMLAFSKGAENTKVLFLGRNLGYSAANNIGARAASGEHLIFLNNDMLVLPGSFVPYLEELQKENAGLVGGRLLYNDNTIQHAGIAFHLSGHPIHRKVRMPASFDSEASPLEVIGITGACIGIRAGLYERLGGFDENYSILYQDVDLCLKVLSAGKRIIYRPDAILYHYESITSGAFKDYDIVEQDWRYLKKQWRDFFTRLRQQTYITVENQAANRNVVIYGTGRLACLAADALRECNVLPSAFVDSDRRRWGGRFLDRMIISPKELTKLHRPLVLIASMYEYEIRESLGELDTKLELFDSCFTFDQMRSLL